MIQTKVAPLDGCSTYQVVCLRYKEVIAEKSFHFLAVGFATGWLFPCPWFCVHLAVNSLFTIVIVYFGSRYALLFSGFYVGVSPLGFYGRAICLFYLLFLYGKTKLNRDQIRVSLDLILTISIVLLFLECYKYVKYLVYWGFIVGCICFMLDKPEGFWSELERRLMMLFIPEKSKENKGILPAVDSSAHPQPKDHNAFRPQSTVAECGAHSNSVLMTINLTYNQKKTRKPSKVPPIKGKSTRNDSKDESGSSVSLHQQDDKQRHRRLHGDDKDDDFLRSCHSADFNSTTAKSCHSADFNSTAAKSCQVMAGQNSNVNGIQYIRDVNIYNSYNFCSFSS